METMRVQSIRIPLRNRLAPLLAIAAVGGFAAACSADSVTRPGPELDITPSQFQETIMAMLTTIGNDCLEEGVLLESVFGAERIFQAHYGDGTGGTSGDYGLTLSGEEPFDYTCWHEDTIPCGIYINTDRSDWLNELENTLRHEYGHLAEPFGDHGEDTLGGYWDQHYAYECHPWPDEQLRMSAAPDSDLAIEEHGRRGMPLALSTKCQPRRAS